MTGGFEMAGMDASIEMGGRAGGEEGWNEDGRGRDGRTERGKGEPLWL